MLGLKYCLGFYIGIWLNCVVKIVIFLCGYYVKRGEGCWFGNVIFKCYIGILFYKICINLIDIYFINYSECLVIIWW